MKEDVIIIHGYKAHDESVWIPWLAKKLEEQGHNVWHPDFPNSADPKLDEWLDKAHKLISETTNDLIIIGHSLGGVLALHLLAEEGEWKHRLKKMITLGAPCIRRKHASNFYDIPWEGIIKNENYLHAIWSKDDPIVGEENIIMIQKKTKARTTIVDGYGHFLAKEYEWLLPYITE